MNVRLVFDGPPSRKVKKTYCPPVRFRRAAVHVTAQVVEFLDRCIDVPFSGGPFDILQPGEHCRPQAPTLEGPARNGSDDPGDYARVQPSRIPSLSLSGSLGSVPRTTSCSLVRPSLSGSGDPGEEKGGEPVLLQDSIVTPAPPTNDQKPIKTTRLERSSSCLLWGPRQRHIQAL